MDKFFALLDAVDTTVVAGGDAAAASGDAAASGGGLFSNPIIMILFYFVIIFALMYFFSIRPQKKREKAMNEMRNAIQPGDPVLLTNGLFGKVVDVTADCYIVEFGVNKGIRIPVLKHEVYAKREPNMSNKEEVVEEPKEKKSLFGGLIGGNKESKEEKTEEIKTEEVKKEEPTE